MFVYEHTFVLSVLIILTHLHTPTKYCPRFPPLCSPDTGRNPITSDLNLHLPSFTSIQWAVTPRNDAFVVSTDQQSAVVETKPGAAWSIWKVSLYVFNETFFDFTSISVLVSSSHWTNLLCRWFKILWVVGKLCLVLFGLMATKQLRNAILFATASDYRSERQTWVINFSKRCTNLIITNYELGNSISHTVARELTRPSELMDCPVKVRLIFYLFALF